MGHSASSSGGVAWNDLLATKEIWCGARHGVQRILVPYTSERPALRVERKAVLLRREPQLLHHNSMAWSRNRIGCCCPVPSNHNLGGETRAV